MDHVPVLSDYEYGFKDEGEILFHTGKGLNEDVIRALSKDKDEPEWMLNYRLESYEIFKQMEVPTWGADLSDLKIDDLTHFLRASDKPARSWEDVPDEIKETFERLGVPEAERAYLAGTTVQYESETIYYNMQEEYEKMGILFTDCDTALKKYPELFKEYFGTVVPNDDSYIAALNGALWSGGTFIYVPKGVKIDVPLQAYYRLNNKAVGQYERTLIIVDEGASVNYVEGCTAPTYTSASLHGATVEVIVKKDASCRFTTIQNWSDNVYNLVTERAVCYEGASMEWIDGNLGSKATMKYPSVVMKGEHSRGMMMTIAFADEGQDQDCGAKMIHLAPNTSSTILSKSISRKGGRVNYRGYCHFGENSQGSRSHIECDTIIMDQASTSDTIPYNEILNGDVTMEHEARISKVSEEQVFYLMSRGLTEEEATEMIIMGFIEPFTKELPMEYAVELNRLINFGMEGSIG